MESITAASNLQGDNPVALETSKLSRLFLPITLVATFVAYSGALRYEFVYDDGDQILRNKYLTSWSYLPRYFTEHLWSHRDFNLPGNYYRPLFLLWLRLNRIVLGVNPGWWHFATLLTYLASVIAAYWLARRLLRDNMTAGIAAMVFALSPLHIEAAAWPSGVTEPLLLLLFIPAFMFYLRGRGSELRSNKSARLAWIAASVVFYALALFSKETAIILPAIIVAYEMICGEKTDVVAQTPSEPAKSSALLKSAGAALLRTVPFLVVSIIYLTIRAMVLGGVVYTPSKLPFVTKLLTIPLLLFGYLKLLLWPVGLSEFYDTPYVERPGLSNFLLPLAAVLAVVFALWWAIKRIKDRRERRIMAFACSWIVIPIIPVLNIATFRKGDLIHDRYLFLPTIGLSLLVAFGVRKLKFGKGQIAGLPVVQTLALILLAGVLGLATAYQHIYWANDIVLFDHSLSVAPGNIIAQNSLGDAFSKREMFDEAIAVFEDLVQREPEYATSQYNLGYNYYKVGRYKEAVPHLAKAIALSPNDERQFLTLGVTLFYLDRYDLAEQALRTGIELRPDGLGLHYALGAVFRVTGKLQDALAEFNQELAYNPGYVSARDQIDQITKQIQAGGGTSGSH